MKLVRYVPMRAIGGKQCKEEEVVHRPGPSLAGIMFLMAQLAYVVVGIACVLIPPEPATRVADSQIPSDATCLRVTRKTNYVTVDVSIGSPGQIASLLLRLDKVLNASDTQRSIRLFSSKVVESSTTYTARSRPHTTERHTIYRWTASLHLERELLTGSQTRESAMQLRQLFLYFPRQWSLL